MLTIHDVFAQADCPDHPLGLDEFILEGAVTLAALGGCDCYPMNSEGNTCGSYCDTESFALARLADGRFITVEEESDTSGHGCRCSGAAAIFATLDDALMLGTSENIRAVVMMAVATSGHVALKE